MDAGDACRASIAPGTNRVRGVVGAGGETEPDDGLSNREARQERSGMDHSRCASWVGPAEPRPIRGRISVGASTTQTCAWPSSCDLSQQTCRRPLRSWPRHSTDPQGHCSSDGKPCLPSSPIFNGWVKDAGDVRAALRKIAPAGAAMLPAFWPASEGTDGAHRTSDVTDERNWHSGLHGGARRLCEGSLHASKDEE